MGKRNSYAKIRNSIFRDAQRSIKSDHESKHHSVSKKGYDSMDLSSSKDFKMTGENYYVRDNYPTTTIEHKRKINPKHILRNLNFSTSAPKSYPIPQKNGRLYHSFRLPKKEHPNSAAKFQFRNFNRLNKIMNYHRNKNIDNIIHELNHDNSKTIFEKWSWKPSSEDFNRTPLALKPQDISIP